MQEFRNLGIQRFGTVSSREGNKQKEGYLLFVIRFRNLGLRPRLNKKRRSISPQYHLLELPQLNKKPKAPVEYPPDSTG